VVHFGDAFAALAAPTAAGLKDFSNLKGIKIKTNITSHDDKRKENHS
jgi:hypothetical protein